MTPAEYGRHLADQAPPLPDHHIDAAARLFAVWLAERPHRRPPGRRDHAA